VSGKDGKCEHVVLRPNSSLILGEVELNLGLQMEKQMLAALREQRKKSRVLCEWLQRNNSSVDKIDIKIGQISKPLKSLREKNGILTKQVN
jgi:hypothetical protein